MKKQLFTVLSFLMLVIGAQAQTNIANYTFASSVGTYVPLTGATTFTTSWDNEVSTSVPLGGNFVFGAVTYTNCYVSANGFITFGAAPAGTNYTPMSTLGSTSGAISAYGQDAASSTASGATPSISAENIGGATGEFVVQFTDHANFYNRSVERLNFQIRLNLATNEIKIVYGPWTTPGTSTSGITSQVGIRGNSTTWASNVNSLNALNTPANTSCNWSNAITSSSNSSSMLFASANTSITPTNGLTFTWAPPVNAALAPVRAFSAVTGITAHGANLSWTAPTGASQYNVQYRVPGTCAWTNFSGNPVSTNSATLTGLNQTTVYQIRVQSSDGTNNAIWSHIPDAAGTGSGYAAAGTFSTLATCPATSNSTVTAIGSSSAIATWTVNGTETAWDVYYGPTPLTAPTATTVPTTTTSVNNYSFSTLNPATAYAVYVRANCGAGDVSTWAGPRNFTTTAIPTDLQVVSMTAPAVASTGCYGSSIPVVIQIKNAGTSVLDFSLNNATLITNITGTNPQSYTTAIATGTLAANATQNVTVTTTYNMSAIGVYSINASATLSSPDVNTSNDVMATATRSVTTGTPVPYMEGFATAATPAGWNNTSSWSFATNHGVTSNGMYYNIYDDYPTASINTLKIGLLPTSAGISFDFRVLNWASTYPGTQVPPTGNWGNLQVQVSTDCGATYNTIATIDNSNHTVTTQAWSNKVYSLAAYAGQSIIVKFVASINGTDPDFFIDLDNINIATCFGPTAIVASGITTSDANVSWTAPVSGTPASYVYEVRTSGAAGSGATGLVTTGTVTAPSTSVTVSGLTALTNYSVYVMSNCGGSDVSPWAAGTFTTLANCPVPTSLTVTAITPTTATASWTAGATETAWDVYYGISPVTAPTATTVPTATTSANSYSFTSLTPSTNYVVYVRANCGSGNESIWTPVNTFTTPCLPPNITSISGSARCGTGTTTLTATADPGAVINWYVANTGGTSVATGSLFTTPTISNTTTYYAEAGNVTSYSENAGPAVITASSTTNSNYGDHGIVFSTTKSNVTVASSKLYINGSGAITISLRNSSGTEISNTGTISVVGNGSVTPLVIPINLTTTTPGSYQLILKSATGITSIYHQTTPVGYPFTSPSGNVSVTSGYWYSNDPAHRYFYDVNFLYSDICASVRTAVTATVTPPPALTANAPAAICGGNGIATLSITSTVADYDSYVWSPNTGLYTDAAATTAYTGGNASTVYVNTTAAGVLNYNISANNSVSGCATSASASVSVLEAPTSITVTGTPNPVCEGSVVTLSATANAVAVALINENFNGATNSWTAINNSTGGTPANAAWTLRPNAYVLPGSTFMGTLTSNDNSQLYLTNSDQQGSGSTTRTILQSPAINTNNLTTLNLNFYHYYRNWPTGDSSIAVQVSTNGTTWNTVKSYTATAGTPSSFAAENINLNSYVNNSTLYVRFSYTSVWGYGWAIDNVQLNGTSTSDYSYSWTSNPAGFTSSVASATAMPTANTEYSVVITNTNTSCSNSAAVTVTVNALPVVTATTSAASVCVGSTATLTAAGATNYTWTAAGTSSTQVVTVSTPSTYTVTGGDVNGCSNTATVSVGTNPTPTVTAVASQTTLCDDGSSGASILTASTNGSSVLWNEGSTTTTISVTPTVTTVYTVTATDAGCSADATVTVDVSLCTGVKELVANGISLYPNPNNGILNIVVPADLTGKTTIEIFDAVGKLVIKESLTTETTTISTTKLSDGMYMFKVINNNNAIKVGKIVKQ